MEPIANQDGILSDANASTPLASKRNRLRSIVEKLGPTASSADIRQEAYRVGFGVVSSSMLVHVRNELWPDRPRRAGRRSASYDATAMHLPESVDGLPRCPSCDSTELRVRQVARLGDGMARRGRVCKSCGERWQSIEPVERTQMHVRRRKAMLATQKQCSTCRRTLPVAAFSKKANDVHLYRSSCRECLNQKRADLYLKRLLNGYCWSLDQYLALFDRQHGRCAICGENGFDGLGRSIRPCRFLCIDHSHVTGRIRGLLCDKCNLGIGNFNDDPQRLHRAAMYLRRARSAVDQDYPSLRKEGLCHGSHCERHPCGVGVSSNSTSKTTD